MGRYQYPLLASCTQSATGGGTKRVYEQAITYDAFSNMTARDTTYWGTADSFSRTYTNGRNSISAYDAAGNITNNGMGDNFQLNTFDAAGRRTGFVERVWLWEEHSARMNEFETDYVFDGDGRPVEERKGTRIVSVPTPPPMNVQVSKYQVWSSVLGASVATLLPDGTPLTRSVFAGKAVIAELRGTGSGVGDMVTWKTSDPASGTVVSYTNDGAANTGFVSEQTEPLGQSVAVTDPEPPNEPQTYEQHLFFASDPEWQCEAAGLGAYGSLFKDRPEHCQRKALYAAGAYLPWEGEVTNVLKISKKLDGIRLPEVLFGGVSGHEIMRRTLSITHKFASGGPSSVGDGGWSQTGEHEWEVTAYDPFPSDIEQSLDPSNAGGDPNPFENQCLAMVSVLQDIVTNAIKEVGGGRPIATHKALDDIVTFIDNSFTPAYLGLPGVTARNLGPTDISGGVPGASNPVLKGDVGFKKEYIDTLAPGEDQTHHFAAYFSAGLNGIAWKAFAHAIGTDFTNDGDWDLGWAAYELGGELRTRFSATTRMNRTNARYPFPETIRTPETVQARLERIRGIADRVRSSICK